MGDHFTVVAITIERGTAIEEVYVFVPHQWVKNESVFLPPNNCLTLRDDPSSAPEPEWKEFKCKIKEDSIVGKEKAEWWENELKTSCTDSEETSLSINRLLAINNNDNKIMAKTIDKTNIDALLDNIAASTPNVNINAAGSTNIESKQIDLSFRNESGILVQEFGDDTSDAANVPISKNQEEVSLNTIFQKLLAIEKCQLHMLDMQKSENSTLFTLNKICDMINNLHGTLPKPTTSHEEPNKSEFENKFNFPLSTVSDVQAFNSEIEKSADYKKYLVCTYIFHSLFCL